MGRKKVGQQIIGELTEESADIVRSESRDSFGYEFIVSVNKTLAIGKLNQKDEHHTKIIHCSEIDNHIFNILDNEFNNLNNKFLSSVHYFGSLMLRSKDGSEVNIIFRLRTVGLEGCTQYRLAWRRISECEYACIEW